MRKFAFLLITILFSSLAVAQPMRFEEGKHYEVIGQTATDTPTVTEFFSFYCPHCYRFEYIAKQLKEKLPENVKFEKSHVDFMRNASPEMQQNLSRALIVGEKLGVGDEVTAAIFKHIHQDRKPFSSKEEVFAIFSAVGTDAEKAKKAFNSFAVKGAANKMKKAQDEMSAKRVLTAVPMLIVNNKYKINSSELKSVEEYTSLIQFLNTLK